MELKSIKYRVSRIAEKILSHFSSIWSSLHSTRRVPSRGYSLIEIVIYTILLTLLAGAATDMLFSLSSATRSLQSLEAVDESAQSSLERIVRETRGSLSIDTLRSTLGTSPGDLYLNSIDVNGASTTVEFFMTGQSIHIKEAGIDLGPLTADNVRVTNLVFRRIATTTSQAVKIELTLESGTSTNYFSKNFYSSAVLRGSYPAQ